MNSLMRIIIGNTGIMSCLEGDLLQTRLSDEDGEIDCQPVVYDRCGTNQVLKHFNDLPQLGQIRDETGVCRDMNDCTDQCGSVGGFYLSRLGICQCNYIEDLDQVHIGDRVEGLTRV